MCLCSPGEDSPDWRRRWYTWHYLCGLVVIGLNVGLAGTLLNFGLANALPLWIRRVINSTILIACVGTNLLLLLCIIDIVSLLCLFFGMCACLLLFCLLLCSCNVDLCICFLFACFFVHRLDHL